jgi:predicted RNA-binding Zn ribbon-like protein
MIFAHDTEVALSAAVALVNTAPDVDPEAGIDEPEELADLAALDDFVRTWQWTGTRTGTPAELAAVHDLRPRLRRIWSVDEDEAVVIVNDLLRAAGAMPQLVKHDGWDYHLHATSAEAPLADRMAVEAAMALTDMIRMKELDRLRICAGEDCRDVLIDLSKNRSRRYCEAGCGNRANVAAYRARRSGATPRRSAGRAR